MRRWWRALNRVAIIVGAIVLLIYGVEAAIAIGRGQIVVGYNYWHAPLFAVLQLILVVALAPFLARYALKHWNDIKPPYEPRD